MKDMIIFYSSFEERKRLERMKQLMENGFEPKHAGMLISFINIEKEKYLMKMLKWFHDRGIKIMVDSGAHSIQYAKDRQEGVWMGHEVSKKAKEIVESESYDDYMADYLDFAERWRNVVDIFVELDIQRVVGYEKVLEWRGMWKDIGITPMYVWHGEEDAMSWVDDTKYIGIGAPYKKVDDLEKLRFSVARKFKKAGEEVWVHIFALTAFDRLRKSIGVYDSVDSSSWKMSSRYGMVYREMTGRLGVVSWKERPKEIIGCINKYKDELEKYGYRIDDMVNFKDFIELDFWNIFIMDRHLDKILNMVASGRVSGFSCAVCPVADRCRYYNPESEGCEWVETLLETIDLDNVLEDTIRFVIESRLKRYLRGLAMEEIDGGMLDRHVTQLEDGIVKMIETYLKLKYPERYTSTGKKAAPTIEFDSILKKLDEIEEE